MKWFFKVLRQYADFSGRARRKEFWMLVLFYVIFFILFTFIDIAAGLVPDSMLRAGIPYGVFTTIWFWAILIPYWAAAIRRLHDTGRSGWFMLITLIPLIGGIWLLVLLAEDGKQEENRYGADPKTSENKWDVNKNNSNVFIFASVALLIAQITNFLIFLQYHGASTFQDYLIMLSPSYGVLSSKDFIIFLLPVGLLLIGIFLRHNNGGSKNAVWCIILYAILCLLMDCFSFINSIDHLEQILSITYVSGYIASILVISGLLFAGIQILSRKSPAVAAVLLITGASLGIIVFLLNSIQYSLNNSAITFFFSKTFIIVNAAYIVFGCSLLRRKNSVEEQSIQQTSTPVNPPKQEPAVAAQRQNIVQAPSKSVTTYQSYIGSGVCDVCNRQLGNIKAYIVPNSVFYNSRAYRAYFKQSFPWTTDADIDRMKQQDRSAGSAVCENCIHMF